MWLLNNENVSIKYTINEAIENTLCIFESNFHRKLIIASDGTFKDSEATPDVILWDFFKCL
jgi:hypothetical protein